MFHTRFVFAVADVAEKGDFPSPVIVSRAVRAKLNTRPHDPFCNVRGRRRCGNSTKINFLNVLYFS